LRRETEVSGKWLLVLSGFSFLVALVFIGFAFKALSPGTTGTMYGTLYVDGGGMAGSSTGPTASYNATLTVQKGQGTVLLTFLYGKDILQNHEISISNYSITTDKIVMSIGGAEVVLPWEDNDTIWNHTYDNNYIGSAGSLATVNETRGVISPSVFGLPAQDYVEFRFQAQGGEPQGSMVAVPALRR
jgi:hypothetical protein